MLLTFKAKSIIKKNKFKLNSYFDDAFDAFGLSTIGTDTFTVSFAPVFVL
jgi:hypothetical protein